MARQASADRARYTQELAQLRNELDQLKSEKASISQKLDGRDPSINMLVDIDKDEVSNVLESSDGAHSLSLSC